MKNAKQTFTKLEDLFEKYVEKSLQILKFPFRVALGEYSKFFVDR